MVIQHITAVTPVNDINWGTSASQGEKSKNWSDPNADFEGCISELSSKEDCNQGASSHVMLLNPWSSSESVYIVLTRLMMRYSKISVCILAGTSFLGIFGGRYSEARDLSLFCVPVLIKEKFCWSCPLKNPAYTVTVDRIISDRLFEQTVQCVQGPGFKGKMTLWLPIKLELRLLCFMRNTCISKAVAEPNCQR